MKKMKLFKYAVLFGACVAALAACSKEEELSTDPLSDKTAVVSYGPLPVMRGGQLRFIGSHLETVREVIIPGVSPLMGIDVVKRGVPSEIRVTVPKDGPEPGQVILRTADGEELKLTTPISFSEPIEFESFSPSSVKPGEVITLKGDYFNLVHEVVFSEEAIVSEKDFIAQSRYEIRLVVPAEASTGKIAVGDLDETDPENEGLFPNLILSEEVLTVAQPVVASVSARRFKAGETITVKGENLHLTAFVKMAGADVTDFNVNTRGSELSFVQPDAARSGDWFLVAKSGIEVPAGELVCVVPTGLSAAPVPVKAGATLTISGKDLDLVKGIELPNAGWVEEFLSGETLSFAMPASAQAGEAVLQLLNDETVTVAYSLVEPVFGSYSANPAAAGSPITITGNDLDLVTSVTFGGDLKVNVEDVSEHSLTVSVPTLAQTGVVRLNLANGTSVECEELAVDTPQACYILELPEPGTEIYGGTVLIVPVANEDKLTDVQVNGQSVNYLLNGSTLYISLPDTASSGTVIALISSNGTVEYTIDCIPNTIQKTVIWSGSWECGSWGGNQDLAWGGFDWSTVEAGTKMVMDFTEDASQGWWQIALRHGDNWGDLPENTFFDLEAGQTSLEVELTQLMLDDLIAYNGLVITGCNYTLTKITLVKEISLETVVWSGAEESGAGMGRNIEVGSEMDWADAGMKEGAKVRVHFTTTDPEGWQIQIFGGHWEHFFVDGTGIGGGKFSQENWDGSLGYVEFVAEGEIYAAMTTQQWWGSAMILQGNNVTFTKLAFL